MIRRDARELIGAIARAVRARFVQRADHDALAARVDELERKLADLRKREDAA
jgi:polyhydroxyalkanoate synthesis regulator phasin